MLAGLNSIPISLPIKDGQYIGWYGTGFAKYITGVLDPVGWYSGTSGAATVTDSAASHSAPLRVTFTIRVLKEQDEALNVRAIKALFSADEFLMIVGAGQSLWEGSDGTVTTASKYDDLGFPPYPDTPDQLNPATVANTQRSGSRGEWPALAAAEHIHDLALSDRGYIGALDGAKLVVANNAVGGAAIDEISQGTAPYNSAIAQATALDGLTDGASRVLAVTFGQGESDSIGLLPEATYAAALNQLAVDYDADLRAATGQAERVPLFSYQMNTTGRGIGREHYKASLDNPLIYCVGPMYPYTYYDTLHINAASSRLVGAMHGAAIKEVCIDNKDWEPLRVISHSVIGNDVVLTFNKSGLVFDTATLPAQTANGFFAKDGGGSAVAVSSTAIINSNQVRLTLASTPASGWEIGYGVSASGRADTFIGSMGNLRDSSGSRRVFDGVELHNWAIVFDLEI